MGPTYAGILGLIAFTATVMRGLLHGGDPDALLMRAGLTMAAFAAIGYIAGRLAEVAVEQSVRSQVDTKVESSTATTVTP